MLLLFGAPALVVFSLIDAEVASLPAPVIDGAQPGGRIEGTVVDRAGAPVVDHPIELQLVGELGERESAGVVRTDGEGRFGFDAPPVRGHYELAAGGGRWQFVREPRSFVDRAGRPVGGEPARLRLEPGCELALTFVRRDGSPGVDGEYELSGELEHGFLFGLIKPEIRKSGAIVAGELAVGGLPPIAATLVARMASGERVELALELVPGTNRKRIEY